MKLMICVVVGLLVVTGRSGKPVFCDDLQLEDIVSLSVANQNKADRFYGTFTAKTGQAFSNEEIEAGRLGKQTSHVVGRWAKNRDDEIFLIESVLQFEMVPGPEVNGLASAMSPFPGPELYLCDGQYAMVISPWVQTADIGTVELYYPNVIFRPSNLMGVIESPGIGDPLDWLTNPPYQLEYSVYQAGQDSVVEGTGRECNIKMTFDKASGFLLTAFELKVGNVVSSYRVLDVARLANGGFIARKTVGVFASAGEFPKICHVFELDEIDHAVDDRSFSTILPDKPFQLRLAGRLVEFGSIEPGTTIACNELADVYTAANNQRRYGEGKQRTETQDRGPETGKGGLFWPPVWFAGIGVIACIVIFVVAVWYKLQCRSIRSAKLMSTLIGLIFFAVTAPEPGWTQSIGPAIKKANTEGSQMVYRQCRNFSVGIYNVNEVSFNAVLNVPGSAIDRLRCEELQQELRLSQRQRSQLLTLLDDYRTNLFAIIANRRVSSSPGSLQVSPELAESEEDILAVLNPDQKKQLVAFDRYLFLRNSGVAEFVQHHSSKPDEALDQSAELFEVELKLWKSAREDAGERWRETCQQVRAALEKSPQLTAWWDQRAEVLESPLGSDLVTHGYAGGVEKLKQLRGDSRQLVKKAFEQKASLFITDEGMVGESSGEHDYGAVGGLRTITSSLRLQQAYTGANDLDFSESQLNEIGEVFTDKLSSRLNEMLLRQPAVTEAQAKVERERLISETFDAIWEVFLPRQQQTLTEIAKFRLELLAGPLQLLEQPECTDKLKAQLEQIYSQYRRDLLEIEVQLQKRLFELLREYGHLDGTFTSDNRPNYLPPSLIVMEVFVKSAEHRK